VDLGAQKLSQSIALNAGDEPGRLVEDGAGRVHVALQPAQGTSRSAIGRQPGYHSGPSSQSSPLCANEYPFEFTGRQDQLR
jgi:hypothetical protein